MIRNRAAPISGCGSQEVQRVEVLATETPKTRVTPNSGRDRERNRRADAPCQQLSPLRLEP
jgi:hypothetical protein